MERRSLYTVGGLAAVMTLLVVTFGRAPEASAEVRQPKEGADVIETLPFAANDPKRREVARLRRTVAADPNNLRAAIDLARLDIKLSRERSDPRYLGHAQAALAPWWNAVDAPTEVLVLRATIEQSLHDFEAALADLDRVLERAPNDVQAWLTRPTILTVPARYGEFKLDKANKKDPGSRLLKGYGVSHWKRGDRLEKGGLTEGTIEDDLPLETYKRSVPGDTRPHPDAPGGGQHGGSRPPRRRGFRCEPAPPRPRRPARRGRPCVRRWSRSIRRHRRSADPSPSRA